MLRLSAGIHVVLALLLWLFLLLSGCAQRETAVVKEEAPPEEAVAPSAQEGTGTIAEEPVPAPPEKPDEPDPPVVPTPTKEDPPTPKSSAPPADKPGKLPYVLPKWAVGQSVTYRLQGEGPNKLDCDWAIAVVGREEGNDSDQMWLEMHIGTGQGRSILKMLTTEPAADEFREDPARVFFGVSERHKPERTIILAPGQPDPLEVDLSGSGTGGAPATAIPPPSRWHFDPEPTQIELPLGKLTCRRFYVTEGAGEAEGAFEAWHSAGVPITGLARMRGRQADGQRFEMELTKIGRSGAKSLITKPARKLPSERP